MPGVKRYAVIHWQCLSQDEQRWPEFLIFAIHEELASMWYEISTTKTVYPSSWGYFWPRQEALTSLPYPNVTVWPRFPLLDDPTLIPNKKSIKQPYATKCIFLFQHLFYSLSWIWVISPHPPVIPAEITVFYSTSTFHILRTCFLSDSEVFGGWRRAPKPSLLHGILVEMYFLLHIKGRWKHRNLSPSGVRYIYKYIHQILKPWSLSRVTLL